MPKKETKQAGKRVAKGKAAAPKETPIQMGRPRKEINFAVFEGLCRIQCTEVEIASVLQVDIDTLNARLKENYGETFSEVYKKHSAPGKISLRRAQFKAAENGNSTMLVWLGKQYLGQKDKHELEVSDKRQNVLSAMQRHREEYPEIPEEQRLDWFAQDSGLDKTELVSEANN